MVLRHRSLNVALIAAVALLLLSPALTFAAPGTFSLVSDADCKVTCERLDDCTAVCEESAECEAICEALEKGTLTEAQALEACQEACSSEACEISCDMAAADCCPKQVQKVSATLSSSCSAPSSSVCVTSAAARVAVRTSAKKDKGVTGPI